MILTVTANASVDTRYVVDSFAQGGVNRMRDVVRTAGGKGLNVSRAARIAGEQVTATGFLAGHLGHLVEDGATEDGVIADFVWCVGETRSCINVFEERTGKITEFLEPGFTIGQRDMEHLADRVSSLILTADVLTISGSMPPGGSPSLYRELIALAHENNVPVVLDTSGEALEGSLDAGPTIIKPNEDEVRTLTGSEELTRESLVDAAQHIRSRGVGAVIVSLGSRGSLMVCEEGVFRAEVPQVAAVNSVGCGDSLVAGLAVGISRGMSLPESLRLASGISAASAMNEGTGSWRQVDFDEVYPKVKVTQVA